MAREFTAAQRVALDQAIRAAEQVSRFEFSVFVGAAEGESAAVRRAPPRRPLDPSRSVLIMVDPAARLIEVVTGSDVRRVLSDQEVAPRRARDAARSSPAATSSAAYAAASACWR